MNLQPLFSDGTIGKIKPLFADFPPVMTRRSKVDPERVMARLRDLGLTPVSAAMKAGLERSFIHDLVEGRKKGVNGQNLNKLAVALNCNPLYLTGGASVPGRAPVTLTKDLRLDDGKSVVLAGVIEPGTLRVGPDEDEALPVLPVSRDPRYVTIPHLAYKAATDDYTAENIFSGQTVVCLDASAYLQIHKELQTDDLVVMTIRPKGSAIGETVIRAVSVRRGVTWLEPATTREHTVQTPIAYGRPSDLCDFEVHGIVLVALNAFL
jgi:hypothetical protein